MPLSFGTADDEPVRLPHVHSHEQQSDLVERVAAGLRAHPRIIMEAHTERDQQRIVAAGKVAGKQLKRGVVTTVVDAWALVEFDDMADRFPVPPESGDPNAAESGRFLPHVQPVSLDQHRPPELPSRVPGAGPKPGKRRRVGE